MTLGESSMEIRYTAVAATAALMLSVIATGLSAVAMSRIDGQVYLGSKETATRTGELLCINGFAYELRPSVSDSGDGRLMLQVMTTPVGEPSYDENGREYPRRIGPKNCS